MVQGPHCAWLETTGDVRGMTEAMGRYGAPVSYHEAYDVSREAWQYWQLVTGKRAGEVVMLVRRRDGRYLVHTKGFYPEGVYRLPSGGIKPGEDLVRAVQREVAEETSLTVAVRAFLAVVVHHFRRPEGEIRFTSYLFELDELDGTLRAADEGENITGFRELSLAGVVGLADELEALPPGWVDWGRFRASLHRVVGEVVGAG